MQAATEATSVESRMQRLERFAEFAAIWLQDLIFPPSCGNCGRVDYRFCASCRHTLEQTAVVLSPGTRETPDELDALIATGKHRGILRSAVQAFKYDGARDLALPLANRLVEALRLVDWRIDFVAPVPLSADREAERGYNQSALLCQPFVAATGLAARADAIRRIRKTHQQAMLSGHERSANVKNAFRASQNVNGLSVLLIDDVVTTGSTLRECARALKAKGADAVYGITISHA
ncbi:MAG: ComF family protein [Chloroflexota bacterium]|nr:ComF family protein [Chloroflexota bacterium]MDE2911133.1 ComF family protein [Chloroflexota bacterium]